MNPKSLTTVFALMLSLGACAITDSGDLPPEKDAADAMQPVAVTVNDQISDVSHAARLDALVRQLNDGALDQGVEVAESPRLMAANRSKERIRVPGVEAAASAVNCLVSNDGPRRISAESIQFGVLMNCNGAIRRATMFLYLFRRLSASDPWAAVASRGPEVFTQNLAGTTVTRTDAVCLPAEYVGVLDITVEFLDGSPLVIRSIFATTNVFIGC
jgi:hypothetical protein